MPTGLSTASAKRAAAFKTCQHPVGVKQLGRDVLCGRYLDHASKCEHNPAKPVGEDSIRDFQRGCQ
jgi:hypothetical protein